MVRQPGQLEALAVMTREFCFRLFKIFRLLAFLLACSALYVEFVSEENQRTQTLGMHLFAGFFASLGLMSAFGYFSGKRFYVSLGRLPSFQPDNGNNEEDRAWGLVFAICWILMGVLIYASFDG